MTRQEIAEIVIEIFNEACKKYSSVMRRYVRAAAVFYDTETKSFGNVFSDEPYKSKILNGTFRKIEGKDDIYSFDKTVHTYGESKRSFGYEADNILYVTETLEDFKNDYPYSNVEVFYKENDPDRKRYASKFNYCYLYQKMPYIEIIGKLNDKLVLARAGGNDKTFFNNSFKPGKNMKEITKMPDWLWKKLIEEKVDNRQWDFVNYWFKKSKKDGTTFNEKTVEHLIEFSENSTEKGIVDNLLKNAKDENGKSLFSPNSLAAYLDRVDMFQAIEKNEALILLNDYVNMCVDLKIVPVTTSNSLKREHDVAARAYRQFVKENKIAPGKAEKLQKAFAKYYDKRSKYEYEDDGFIVICPKDPKDLLIEGNQNRNCVGSYTDRYAKGKSEIFFVRKKETPDKSYITIETMNNATEIYQAYYSSNRTIDNQKDLNFLNKWIARNKVLNETALND